MSVLASTGNIKTATKNTLTGHPLKDSNQDSRKPIMAGKSQTISSTTAEEVHKANDSSGNGVSKPPTAMVAPLFDTSRPLSDHPNTTSPSSSPLVTRKNRTGNVESSPSGEHKYVMREVQSPLRGDVPAAISVDKLRNLMNILNEKSQIIERQKKTITRLQQECKEKDTHLRTIGTRSLSEITTSESTVSSSDSGSAMAPPVQADILSRKLDAAYFEIDKVTSECKMAQEKLHDKEKVAHDLEGQLQEIKKTNDSLTRKIGKLEGYLGNMPTMEEHHSMKEDLRDVCNTNQQLTERLRVAGVEQEELKKEIQDKEDRLLSSLDQKKELEADLKETKRKLQYQDKRVVQLHGECSSVKVELQKVKKLLGAAENDKQVELQAMRERHRQRFAEATIKIREQYKKAVKRTEILELQLAKNSDAMATLTSELKMSQGNVGELKSSMNDLVTENQDLLKQNIALKGAKEEASRAGSSTPDYEAESLTQQLAQELGHGVKELDSLVCLITSILEGKDPNASALLGVNSSEPTPPLEVEGLEARLEKVRHLCSEIERIRGLVADQIASQVAVECTVQ